MSAQVIVAVVVLMNLLIAMMSNTFGRIVTQSSSEWRLLFAELVKEYIETPMLPPPLSPLQHALNLIMRMALKLGVCVDRNLDIKFEEYDEGKHKRTLRGALDKADSAQRTFAWGRYLSPNTAFVLKFQLDVASSILRNRLQHEQQ